MMKNLGNKLKRLRHDLGYTQQQIADAINIDRSTYSYYETGKTSPDLKTVSKLLKIFNLTYDQLLSDSFSPYNLGLANVKDSEADEDEKHLGENLNVQNLSNLTKDEKQLIIFYRLLNKNDQQALIDHAFDKVAIKVKKRK